MEILIILLLSLFALGKSSGQTTVQWGRGGPAPGAMGTIYGGSGRGGTDAALGKPTTGPGTVVIEGMAGDPSGTAETLDEEASYTTESSGAMTGVLIGPHLR